MSNFHPIEVVGLGNRLYFYSLGILHIVLITRVVLGQYMYIYIACMKLNENFVLSTDQITVDRNEMCVKTSIFTNAWSQIKQM